MEKVHTMKKDRTSLILWVSLLAFLLMLTVPTCGQIKRTPKINPSVYDGYNNQCITYKSTAKGWKVLATFTASIALDAMADGYRDEGNKTVSHLLEAASVGTMVSGLAWSEVRIEDLPWLALSYINLRIGMFDLVYNGVRGLPWNYHGTTSHWDGLWNELNPGAGEGFGRAIFFSMGIAIPLQQL